MSSGLWAHDSTCRSIVKSFQQWADEDVGGRQKAGLCFQDCYISTVDGAVHQMPKDPRRGCYVSIPASLCNAPSLAVRRRYASILLSSFAGSDGLKVLLNQCALVVARARQPDVLHAVVGVGQDGKSLIFQDHLQAAFGSGFSGGSCGLLQREREFQVQGCNFSHAIFISIDEAKGDCGILDDVFKLFIGGGSLPLRRNHESETRYGRWPFTGKVWSFNTGDTPKVATAEERSYARRVRCTYMRSTFTNIPSEVNVASKVFVADPGVKDFMVSGAAVWCLFQDWVFPHLQKHGIRACSDGLEFMEPGSQTARDTAWLLKRMNRTTEAATPDELEAAEDAGKTNGAGQSGSSQPMSRSERIVRETHDQMKSWKSVFFSSVVRLVVLRCVA